MNDSLSKRFSFKFIANLFSVLISSIITIIVPRVLGPNLYGDFMFLNDHFKKIIGFLTLGTPMGFFIKISKRREEITLLKFYIYFLILILSVSSLFLAIIYIFDYDDQIYLKIGYQFVILSFLYSFLLFLIDTFRKVNDAYGLTVFSEKYFLLNRVAGLFIILIFVYFKILNLLNYFFILIFTSLALLISWFIYLNKSNIRPFSKKYIIDKILAKKYVLEMYLYSHPLFVKGIVVLIVGIGERWLLQLYGGSEQQGFYSFSFALASIIILFTTSIAPIFTTDFSIAWKNNDYVKMRKLFNTLVHPLVFITSFLSFFVASNGVEIMILFGGKSYEGAGLSLMILALYPIHQTYGQLCGAVLYSSGKTKIVRNVSIPVQIIGLCVVYFFISPENIGGLNLGAVGLSYKMIFLQIIAVNIYLWYCVKILSLSFTKHILKQFLMFFILFIFSFGLKFIFKNTTDFIILNLIINGVFYLIISAVFIFIFPSIINLERRDLYKFFKKYFKA